MQGAIAQGKRATARAQGRAAGGMQGRPAATRPGQRPALPTRPRRRLPALPALVALFVLAGTIRLALGIDGAMAQGASDASPAGDAANAASMDSENRPADEARDNSVPAARAMRQDAVFPDSEKVADILLDLRQREARLAERAEKVEERLALLDAAEDRVARQIEALRDAESALDATMALADELAEGDLGRLVAVFEAMRAEQAARVFAEMDPTFAAGFLARLRPETAAGILAGLEPYQAYALSTILAGRNAEVPTRSAP